MDVSAGLVLALVVGETALKEEEREDQIIRENIKKALSYPFVLAGTRDSEGIVEKKKCQGSAHLLMTPPPLFLFVKIKI